MECVLVLRPCAACSLCSLRGGCSNRRIACCWRQSQNLCLGALSRGMHAACGMRHGPHGPGTHETTPGGDEARGQVDTCFCLSTLAWPHAWRGPLESS
eukprot:8645361-Lingulodinium_polyedra.AAC.1